MALPSSVLPFSLIVFPVVSPQRPLPLRFQLVAEIPPVASQRVRADAEGQGVGLPDTLKARAVRAQQHAPAFAHCSGGGSTDAHQPLVHTAVGKLPAHTAQAIPPCIRRAGDMRARGVFRSIIS